MCIVCQWPGLWNLFVLLGLEEMEVKFPPQTGFFFQIAVITRDVTEGRLMLLTNDFNNSDQAVLIGEWRIFVYWKQ